MGRCVCRSGIGLCSADGSSIGGYRCDRGC